MIDLYAMGEELARLRAENAELRTLVKRLQYAEAQIAALALGDKRLLKDAERYRWLREMDVSHEYGVVNNDMSYSPALEELDAAIDAAMKGQT